jgi:hypothetical protein
MPYHVPYRAAASFVRRFSDHFMPFDAGAKLKARGGVA